MKDGSIKITEHASKSQTGDYAQDKAREAAQAAKDAGVKATGEAKAISDAARSQADAQFSATGAPTW